MKHRHEMSRKSRNTGGVNTAEMDEKTKPKRFVQSKVEDEAEERKEGGRAKKKVVGCAEGDKPKARADHKPRKSGGRVGADSNPFSSARSGEAPKGRKLEMN